MMLWTSQSGFFGHYPTGSVKASESLVIKIKATSSNARSPFLCFQGFSAIFAICCKQLDEYFKIRDLKKRVSE